MRKRFRGCHDLDWRQAAVAAAEKWNQLRIEVIEQLSIYWCFAYQVLACSHAWHEQGQYKCFRLGLYLVERQGVALHPKAQCALREAVQNECRMLNSMQVAANCRDLTYFQYF